MSITIKNITELPAGTPTASSPFIYGDGVNLFRSTLQAILDLTPQGITDLSFSVQDVDVVLNPPSVVGLDFDVTISAGEIKFLKITLIDSGYFSENIYIVPLGAGAYEPLSSTLSLSDLILVDSQRLGTPPAGANTITYVAADLAAINASDPPLDLTDSTKIYFIDLDDGFYRFTGTNGSYGVGGLTMVEADLELLTDIVTTPQPATATPPGSGTFSIDLSNYFGTDYSGSSTALETINIASGSVLGGFARVKGNWANKPTFTGATEAGVSNYADNTDLYLYVEKWSACPIVPAG
jgi:hypothetical protein